MSLVVVAATLAAGAVMYALDQEKRTRRAVAMTGGDPKHALQIIARYGCAACHEIPGANLPGGHAAVSLAGVAERLYLGGAVPTLRAT